MGGFISSMLAKGAEGLVKGSEKEVFRLEGSSLGREANAFIGTQNWELGATPEGKLIKSYIEKTHEAELPILHKLEAPRKALWEGIKADPALVKQFDYANTTLQDIHTHLQGTGHPLTQHSDQLVKQGAVTLKGRTVSQSADKTLEQLSFQHNRQASLLAQAQVMGKNMEHITPLIMKLRDSPNVTEREMGQRYADIIANEFRDRQTEMGFSKTGPLKGAESRTKATMNKAFATVNKFRRLEGSSPVPLLDTKPTYSDQGTAERVLTDILRTVQVPLAFLPHSSMEFNLALRAPAKALVKGLMGEDSANSAKILEASHVLAIQDTDALQQDIAARTGKIAKWTDSPTVGSILNKTFHMPLFNDVRKMQIRHSAIVGFHSAIHWAEKLTHGSKMAELELRAMHIDPAEVLKQGGQLNEKQLTTAVYHFSNDTMFLKQGMNMPLGANKNFFTRSMYMYHFFIRNEAFFLQKTLTRMLRGGDMAGVARYVGALCIAWPAVAPLLEGLEILGRTGSPSQAIKPAQQLYTPNNSDEWIDEYAHTLGQFGAMGTFRAYHSAVKNYSLWKQVVGPKISTPVTYLQDAWTAAAGKGSTFSQRAKPLERDLLQTVPVVGKPLSHQLVPTTKEQPKYSPHHHHSKLRRKR